MCRCPYISRFLYVLTFVAAMSAAWAARCSADVIWTDAERDSYVSWLHAAAAADSIAAADSTARIVDSLYPSGYAGDYRLELPLIDLGSATRGMEAALARSRVADMDHEIGPQRDLGRALALARNYRLLTEYDHALELYREVLGSRPEPGIAVEAFATAVLHGDSLQVTRELLNIVGASGLAERAGEVELGYRYLLSRGSSKDLELLMQKVDAQPQPMPARIRFWHSFAHGRLGHDEAMLYHLRLLLAEKPDLAGLPAMAGGWVAGIVPDLLLGLGRIDQAAEHYELLAKVGPRSRRDWGRHQLGNIRLLQGDYAAARACLENISNAGDEDRRQWRRRVAMLADAAARLDRIRKEGEPYGTADLHDR